VVSSNEYFGGSMHMNEILKLKKSVDRQLLNYDGEYWKVITTETVDSNKFARTKDSVIIGN
jgi:hypothetical protein